MKTGLEGFISIKFAKTCLRGVRRLHDWKMKISSDWHTSIDCYISGNVECKWRRLTSNDVIRRFLPSSVKCCRRLTSKDVKRRQTTSFDSTRQTWRFSTNFVEVVENWQFLTNFDDFRRFWKFLKFSKNSSTIFDKSRRYSTFKRRRSTSIVVKWRPFTSFYVDQR